MPIRHPTPTTALSHRLGTKGDLGCDSRLSFAQGSKVWFGPPLCRKRRFELAGRLLFLTDPLHDSARYDQVPNFRRGRYQSGCRPPQSFCLWYHDDGFWRPPSIVDQPPSGFWSLRPGYSSQPFPGKRLDKNSPPLRPNCWDSGRKTPRRLGAE